MIKLEELEQRIRDAKEAYYNSGKTIMSDIEYDNLVEMAERLGYIETVGSQPASSLPKIEHNHLMLSLDKVHTAEEVERFVGDKRAILMYKLDGLTCSATYKNGVLARLETRGNGEIGNDIMVHAKSFDNLPLTIEKSGTYVVDGEAIILRQDFEKINQKLSDDQKYRNPRNLAAGTLNLLDPVTSKSRHLKFFAWDVIEGGKDTLHESLDEAADLGFTVVPYAICRDNLQTMLGAIRVDAEEDGIPIDGVVVKYDDINLRDELGHTGHHFQNAKAYKYEDETYPTKLLRVDWTMGKTGQLTPVAIFEPVEIGGSVVEKASLFNISTLKETLGEHPYVGEKIYVKKSNDIIPYVSFADKEELNE